MKNLFKVSSYILATVLVLVLSNGSAFAADNNGDASSTSAMIVGAISILLLVVMLPTIRRARKAETN